MFGFAERLNIQNRVNSVENCVCYMYTISGVAEELIIQNCVYVMEIVHIICTKYHNLQKNWISRIA